MVHHLAALLLLAAALCGAAVATGQEQLHSVTISQQGPRNLMDALADDSIGLIELSGDYVVSDQEANPWAVGNPLFIRRNVTIQAAPGTWPELDLRFQHEILHLCAACTLTLRGLQDSNLTVKNEHLGSGLAWDAIVGQPGSAVVMRGVYVLRTGCTSPEDQLGVVLGMPRSKVLPGAKEPQRASLVNATYRGTPYPSSLFLEDVTRDDPAQYEEGHNLDGGYAVGVYGTTRLCQQHIDEACLHRKSPDMCVEDIIEDSMQEPADEPRRPDGGGAHGLGPAAIAAAIVLPVAVVAGAVLALVLWQRQRRLHNALQLLPTVSLGLDKGGSGASSTAGRSSRRRSTSGPRSGIRDSGGAYTSLREPLGTSKGWEEVGRLTSPLVGQVEDDTVEFGELLGAGSFGRVFRGCWAGRDVAIKVLEHGGGPEARAVENEVQLTLFINNPFVVRAYHSVTFRRAQQGSGVAKNGGGGCDSDNGNGDSGSGAGRPGGNGSGSGSGGSGAAGSQGHSMMETWLVQEFCDCGTLNAYLSRCAAPAAHPEDEELLLRMLRLLRDTARGLAALHQHNVVHGDLSARNVLVATAPGTPLGVAAKLADLGLSRVIKQHGTHRTTQTVGTMSHCPPELLRSGRMSSAGDVYAFSILAWESYTGQQAFRKLQYGEFFSTVVLRDLRPLMPEGIPADLRLLLEHCWATDPTARPEVDRVLECLDYMIQERELRKAARDGSAGQAPGGAAAGRGRSSPVPALLSSPPPRKQWWQHRRSLLAALVGEGDEEGEGGGAPPSSSEGHNFPRGSPRGNGPPSGKLRTASDSLGVGGASGSGEPLPLEAYSWASVPELRRPPPQPQLLLHQLRGLHGGAAGPQAQLLQQLHHALVEHQQRQQQHWAACAMQPLGAGRSEPLPSFAGSASGAGGDAAPTATPGRLTQQQHQQQLAGPRQNYHQRRNWLVDGASRLLGSGMAMDGSVSAPLPVITGTPPTGSPAASSPVASPGGLALACAQPPGADAGLARASDAHQSADDQHAALSNQGLRDHSGALRELSMSTRESSWSSRAHSYSSNQGQGRLWFV